MKNTPGETRNLARKIEHFFPSLRIRNARRILTGWDNVVLEVNSDYIFRFPRFRVAEMSLRREIGILRALTNRVSTPVPEYKYVWLGENNAKGCFAGYTKIQGMPLTIGGFRRAWTKKLASCLGQFIRELHGINVSGNEFRMLSRPTVQERKHRLERTYDDVSRLGYKYLDKRTRLGADAAWQHLLADVSRHDANPVLVHGDLGQRNILLDGADGRLTGILDWGDASINDPALDFSHLFEVNRNLARKTLEIYGNTSHDFMKRIEAYWRTEPFYDLLHGIIEGSKTERNVAIKRISRRLAAPGLGADPLRPS